MPQGNDDTTVASRKILEGDSMINGDFSPPPPILKQALTQQKDQLQLVPSGGGRWVAHEHDDQAVRRRRTCARR